MKTRLLRDIEVSEVGMGCMALSHGYGKIPSETYSIEAIRNAYDHGCNFFDTAEVYSPNLAGIGHNELIVGKALKDIRKNVVIATKLMPSRMGSLFGGGMYKTVKDHLLASLDRLQTDYVDIYYLHRTHGVSVEKVAEAMGRLIDEGLIRGWGLSQVDVDVIDRAQRITPLAAIQNIYSMVERDVEDDVIPYCAEHRIGLVAFSPVASGLLSGKVKVFKDGVGGRAQTMRLYKPVEYFGYRAYISNENIHCTAAAFESSVVAKIPLKLIFSFVKTNNELAWFFIEGLAKLLGMSDERTVSLTQKHIRGRLAESLLYLRDSYGLEEDGCTLSIYLSREDLANLSNMTTSNAIRTLSAFATEHLVAIDGKKIKLINEAELERISRMG